MRMLPILTAAAIGLATSTGFAHAQTGGVAAKSTVSKSTASKSTASKSKASKSKASKSKATRTAKPQRSSERRVRPSPTMEHASDLGYLD